MIEDRNINAMIKETINTSTRDTRFGQRPGKNPARGKPFEIILLLDCHKMFKKEHNEPSTILFNKITQQYS